ALVGGWSVDVLPFLDLKNLRERITPGSPILSAPGFLLTRPRNMSCPVRGATGEPTPNTHIEISHYVLVPSDKRKTYSVFEAPIEFNAPWASGPEMSYNDVIRQTGPHQRGFFYASGFQHGVGFILDGQSIH